MMKTVNQPTNAISISTPRLVAEVGCNHMGQMKLALKMVNELRKIPLLKIIKFQKRTISPQTLKNYDKPHPDPKNSFGKTYGEHRESLELNLSQHNELKSYIESHNLDYMTSVWDLQSAEDILSLKPKHIKIPSARNTNKKLIDYLIKSPCDSVHLSMGMQTPNEIQRLISYVHRRAPKNKKIIFYFCVSGYPTPSSQASLLELLRIKNTLTQLSKTYQLGFSNHDPGIALDSIGLAYGAQFIERHVTLNKKYKGTDHKFSLVPKELLALSRNLEYCSPALQYRPQNHLLSCETSAEKKLK